MPVIVVESVNRKPTANPPGVTTSFPAVPTKFKVADLRLTDPKAPQMQVPIIQPLGRVTMRNYPLGSLIVFAWGLHSAASLALTGPGAPKLMTDTHLDLIADMPITAGGLMRFDLFTVRPALQALLIERFKIKAHYEDQPKDAYTLVAVEPKLQKADPKSRSGCKVTLTQTEQGAPLTISSLVYVVTCKNVTMAEFAAQLDELAGPYVVYPVLDGTGLDGSWDLVLTYSMANIAESVKRGYNVNAPLDGGADLLYQAGAASDPTGGIALLEAVEKQLGLKLEVHKRLEPSSSSITSTRSRPTTRTVPPNN